ncbi:MAG: DUF1330 domain-containing protein [Sphingobium sp.]|jgi:uncharacterized protein (DUF1330 family)|nr:DUF1330 domain-containing protein [Sphingobium sp.]MCI1270792.1 DUF1330 domain-containing protein [Sphingobium sp.]MCI1756404.1 DUF1330 domain-containing protein [Sphingobium sp.]MCI2051901.1 DUF1330 domain-containing protein [Sphingobium sp.]
MAYAYIISQVSARDLDAFQAYRAKAPDTISLYGGEYLVRGGEFAVIEGEANPNQLVVIRFPSMEQARRWYNSQEYSSIRPMRFASADTIMWLVEGIAEHATV